MAFQTTPNWQDPNTPPSPGDPYYQEWYNANQQAAQSAGLPPPSGSQTPGYSYLQPGQPGTVQYGQPPPQTPPPIGGGSPGGGGGGTTNYGPFATPGAYQPLQGTPGSWAPYPQLPSAPQFPTLPQWQDPSMATVQQDPGYQFAAQQGEQALQQNQAAQGLANTGGSLKDILAWGQNYAAQRYGDVRNRLKDTYNTNIQNQYIDPWMAKEQQYQTAVGTWGTNLSAAQRQNEFLSNQNYATWQANNQNWQNYQGFLWGPNGPVQAGG